MPAYTAVPTTEPPWPGVVVIHDFTGMSQDLRGQADWLAGEGFLAIAPDLYYWGSRLRCLRTIMGDLGPRRGRSFDDIEAARRWLRDHVGCSGVVGVVGFCMGGGYAIALAGGPRVQRFGRELRRMPLRCQGLVGAGVPSRGEFRRC